MSVAWNYVGTMIKWDILRNGFSWKMVSLLINKLPSYCMCQSIKMSEEMFDHILKLSYKFHIRDTPQSLWLYSIHLYKLHVVENLICLHRLNIVEF